MESSSDQKLIYDTWSHTNHNLLIQAVAGSGKTTSLMGILALCEYRTLFLAFNKSIQEEITGRIESAGYSHAKAMTLHSLGLSAIRGSKKVTIRNGKNYDIIKNLQNYNKRLFSRMSWEEKVKTSMTLMDMNDVSRIYLTDDLEEIYKFMEIMDKFSFKPDNIDSLWTEFLNIRAELDREGIIDFLDMIYLPVKHKLYIPVQPYYLMIDEAQDLSVVQHAFVDQFIAQGDIKKWVAVGDRRQSIYGFSGSYSESFDTFKDKGNVVELPLGVCYRCPQLIIDEANDVYNVMTGFKEEPGIVEDLENFDEIQPGSMIICRNSGPLLDAYFNLLSRGLKVYIKGEDIMGSINRFLKPYSYDSISTAGTKMNVDIVRLKEKETKSDEERYKLFKMQENYKNFVLLSKYYAHSGDKVSTVMKSLEDMFQESSDSDAVTLCTIHKSKGLEADVVYILNENLIPSKFAKSKTQLEQEQNLKYVARTRAKKELYYLNIKSNSDE